MAENFQNVLEEAQKEWMDLEGVEAVGQGEKDGRKCIDVYISDTSPEIQRAITPVYKSVPVVIHDSGGSFNAQGKKTNGSINS